MGRSPEPVDSDATSRQTVSELSSTGGHPIGVRESLGGPPANRNWVHSSRMRLFEAPTVYATLQ